MRENEKDKCVWKYEDILNLPHHVSKKHPHMSLEDRAAQFAPFAALTGHKEAIGETARVTDRKIELDENSRALLDERLQRIKKLQKPEIKVTYFQADLKKEGGEYVTITGKMKRIDKDAQAILLEDGTYIAIKEILDLKCADESLRQI